MRVIKPPSNLFLLLQIPSSFLIVYLANEMIKNLGINGLYIAIVIGVLYWLLTLWIYKKWFLAFNKKILENSVYYQMLTGNSDLEDNNTPSTILGKQISRTLNSKTFYKKAIEQSEKDTELLKKELLENSKKIRSIKAQIQETIKAINLKSDINLSAIDLISDPVVTIDHKDEIVNQNQSFKSRYNTEVGDKVPNLSENPWSIVKGLRRILVYVERDELVETLTQRIEKKNQESLIVSQMNEKLIRGKSVSPITDHLLKTIDHLFGLDFAGFHTRKQKGKWERRDFKNRDYLDAYDDKFSPFDYVSEEWIKHPSICFVKLDKENIKSLVLSPLEVDGKKVGIMSLWIRTELDDHGKQLIKVFNNQLSLVIQRAFIFDALRNQYFNTIQALVNVIEAKDKYTEGHSRRVSRFSVEIAKKLGYSNDLIEDVEISGLLHDVGKIGIHEGILTKQGKLTADEYEIMKLHPEKALQILQAIDLDSNIMDGILYHHLRYDLSGYPRVALDKLPAFAAIIGAADAFDAITSARSYSGKSSIEEAIKELNRCKGTQFDPKIVEVFEDLVKDSYDRLEAIVNDYEMTKRDIKGEYHVISGII